MCLQTWPVGDLASEQLAHFQPETWLIKSICQHLSEEGFTCRSHPVVAFTTLLSGLIFFALLPRRSMEKAGDPTGSAEGGSESGATAEGEAS